MVDTRVILRDWKLLLAATALLAAIIMTVVLPPFVNASDARTASLADPPQPYGRSDGDQLRQDDLQWLAETLEAHRSKKASYPRTEEPAAICARLGDEGCVLWEIASGMFASDGTTPYYYDSDGREFTVYAKVAGPIVDESCPAQLPPGWERSRTLCIGSGGASR